MNYIAQTVFTQNDLQHYGVKGMKWRNHSYSVKTTASNFANRVKKTTEQRKANKLAVKAEKKAKKVAAKEEKVRLKAEKKANTTNKDRAKKIAKGAAIAGLALGAAYGAHKASKNYRKQAENLSKVGGYYGKKANKAYDAATKSQGYKRSQFVKNQTQAFANYNTTQNRRNGMTKFANVNDLLNPVTKVANKKKKYSYSKI